MLIRDVTWINANGSEMQDQHWKDSGMKCFGVLIDGGAQVTGIASAETMRSYFSC
jgi:isoamylase